MTLPYDTARCAGYMATRTLPGGVTVSLNMGRVECLGCLRRTSPGRADGAQPMMAPPTFERGRCPQRIDPRQQPEAAA